MSNRFLISFLLSLLTASFVTVLTIFNLGQSYELFFHDLWFNLRGSRSVPNDIVVVAMDEISYKNLNVPLNQAWPRAIHAKLLEKLSAYNVNRVIFDILFIDESVDTNGDKALESALHKIPTYLGAEASLQQVAGAGGSFTLEEILEPYEPFRKASAGIALVGLPDSNGVIRNFSTEKSERTSGIKTLAEAGVRLNLSDKPGSRDLINYYGPPRTIPTYSYYQVLEDERPFPKDVFEGKTVYVGMSLRSDIGPSKKDLFRTPFYGSPIFGVEVHATAAANLTDKSWIKRFSIFTESIFIFLSALIFSTVLIYSSPVIGLVCLLVGMIGWTMISLISFLKYVFVPGSIFFLGVLPFIYTLSTFYSFLIARKSEQKLRHAFELYVSPQMVSQLHGKDVIELGGKKVWATALFTDIGHFTEITEELPPERVAEMLNDYFTQVMEVVFNNKGTLIKFIGDAVFVIWGAPIAIDNHAELAIKTAILLQKEVDRFNSTKKYPELNTRIGIHTGPMVVGNLGSKKRFDYTAIGDAVNLASRIEGLNKYFETKVLFTETSRKDAGLIDTAILIGAIKVKGKKEVIPLYTAFDPSPTDEAKSALNDSLQAFRSKRWEIAKGFFVKLGVIDNRFSGISSFYSKLIDTLVLEGVSDDWSGEVEFDRK